MDKVFQEESRNLQKVEKRLDGIANGYDKESGRLGHEIATFVRVDYDDAAQLADLYAQQKDVIKRADDIREIQKSPYFGRMDLDIPSENTDEFATLQIYVGEKQVSDGTEQIVLDWRSPLGNCIYIKNQKSFDVQGYHYQLALRRMLEIKNKKLISYNTEYDGETVTLEGDVVDPFLLTVLKDKRRQNRLTDIIRTIQGNQNDIIRRPLNESFIVQGCAGSGKTMILLHRLSYLKFNNRSMSFAGVKIITPNRFFDAHINDLSRELGLDTVERFSVEEYYVELIRRYFGKIPVSADVISEKALNSKLLEDIYSEKYLAQSIEHYHVFWQTALEELKALDLSEVFSKYHVILPTGEEHNYETFSKLNASISTLVRYVNETDEKNRSASSRQQILRKEISELQQELQASQDSLEEKRIETFVALADETDRFSADLDQIQINLNVVKSQKQQIEEEKKNSLSDVTRARTLISWLEENRLYLLDPEQIGRFTGETIDRILSKAGTHLSNAQKAEKEFKSVAVYNFGKRNALRRQIVTEKEAFSLAAEAAIQELIYQAQDVISANSKSESTYKERIEKLDAQIQFAMKSKDFLTKSLVAHRAAMACFDNNATPDVKQQLPKPYYEACAALLDSYSDQYSAFTTLLEQSQRKGRTLAEAEEEIRNLAPLILTIEEREKLNTYITIAKQLSFSDISRNVLFKDLQAKYREHQQEYGKHNYRHKLYLRLLFSALYYVRMTKYDNLVNIDEAQDISVAEYRVLKMALGDRCIFNLYGDVNQSVYTYKGISDWETLHFLTGTNLYMLNENYRNTLQITKFCNEEFGAEVFPIGISGDDVQELSSLDAAIAWALKKKKANANSRVAVLYRYGHSTVREALKKVFSGEECSWDEVDEKRVSVLSVEMAKGLEFDSVVAVVDKMTANERYVSYTRALEALCVVRQKFSGEIKETAIEPNNDDEAEVTVEPEIQLDYDTPTENDYEEVLPEIDDEFALDTSAEKMPAEEKDPASEEGNSIVTNQTFDADLTSEFETTLSSLFNEEIQLAPEQKCVITSLHNGSSVAYCAPSGWRKSTLLYMLAHKAYKEQGKQTILTGEAHLQENELVLAERLGLFPGYIAGEMQNYLKDFKKEKYEVIFVPYDFLERAENVKAFVEYFAGRVAYWGIDHPSSHTELWDSILHCSKELHVPLYVMSKEALDSIDVEDFTCCTNTEEAAITPRQKYNFLEEDEKLRWISENADLLYGQGIVYCDNLSSCKAIRKALQKKKVLAEVYDVQENGENIERINHLTNTFTKGGLPILVTTHEHGKNLTNPNIRFILHFDIPSDSAMYHLHVTQIGASAEDPHVYDLA